MTKGFLLGIAMLAASCPLLADDGCASFVVPATKVDLAPPAGMVDVCTLDAVLCERLTQGYPPSTKTYAYFVPTAEWEALEAGTAFGFKHYLIAQSGGVPASAFAGLQEHLRSRGGAIPDHTQVPSILQQTGKVNLGILEDSPDAMVFGALATHRLAPPAFGEFTQAASNIAFVAKNEVLSLYVFVNITEDLDIAPMRELTGQWLGCLRDANRADRATADAGRLQAPQTKNATVLAYTQFGETSAAELVAATRAFLAGPLTVPAANRLTSAIRGESTRSRPYYEAALAASAGDDGLTAAIEAFRAFELQLPRKLGNTDAEALDGVVASLTALGDRVEAELDATE